MVTVVLAASRAPATDTTPANTRMAAVTAAIRSVLSVKPAPLRRLVARTVTRKRRRSRALGRPSGAGRSARRPLGFARLDPDQGQHPDVAVPDRHGPADRRQPGRL